MADNPNDTLAKISRIIESGNLEGFIGMKEDEFFDAKSEAYDLTSEDGKKELAKDVSAFANSGGGYIIIGLETDFLPIGPNAEIVNNLKLLKENEFQIGAYITTVREYIYPGIDRTISIKYTRDKKKSNNGVGYIFVPPQNKNGKFYVMKKDDKVGTIIIYGLYKRLGSSNEPLAMDKLNKNLREGLSTTVQRLTIIEEIQDAMLEKLEKVETSQAELMQKIIPGLQRTNEPESLQIQGATDDILRKRIQEIKEG